MDKSILNDGLAIVFFGIFKLCYLQLFGGESVGEDVGWGKGVDILLQLVGVRALLGLVFGLGTCALLFILKRRLLDEENVFQVVSTLTTACPCFFISEIVCKCSGIVAVVVCDIALKTFGKILDSVS